MAQANEQIIESESGVSNAPGGRWEWKIMILILSLEMRPAEHRKLLSWSQACGKGKDYGCETSLSLVPTPGQSCHSTFLHL